MTEETTSQASDEPTTDNERNTTEEITIVPTRVTFKGDTIPQMLDGTQELTTETQDKAITEPDQSVTETITGTSLQDSTANTRTADEKDREEETTEITTTIKAEEITT